MMEAASTSETSVNFTGQHGAKTQKAAIYKKLRFITVLIITVH
jgi:hypothetical protein